MFAFSKRRNQPAADETARLLGENVGRQIAGIIVPFLDASFVKMGESYLDIAKQRTETAWRLKTDDIKNMELIIALSQEYYGNCDELLPTILDALKHAATSAYDLADAAGLRNELDELAKSRIERWIVELKDNGLDVIIMGSYPYMTQEDRDVLEQRGRQVEAAHNSAPPSA